jgi:hypothetical protein
MSAPVAGSVVMNTALSGMPDVPGGGKGVP